MNKVIKMLIIASASILFVGSINLLIVHGDTRNLATGQDNNRLNMIQNIQSTGNPVSTNSDFSTYTENGRIILEKYVGTNTDIIIPAEINEIGQYAFNMSKVRVIHFAPESKLDTIHSSAFADQTTLEDIYLPNSLTYIGDCAFKGCTGLTKLEIPSSLKRIGLLAFANCTKLSSVYFNDGLIDLELCAFEGDTSLSGVHIPSTIKNNGTSGVGPATYTFGEQFRGCDALKSITFSNELKMIPGGLFQLSGIVNLVIPDTITEIGPRAFEACSQLKSIKFGNGLQSIDSEAFDMCKNLESVEIPGNVKRIERLAFYNCTNLASVILNEGIVDVEIGAFGKLPKLTMVTIPASIKNTYQYKRETYDETVSAKETNPDRGSGFVECDNLTKINLSNTATEVPPYLLENVPGLITITLPKSITKIGENSFRFNDKLSSINLETSVTDIEEGAFKDCTSLKDIKFSDALEKLGPYVFQGCTSLTNISTLGKITEVQGSTFADCTSLESVIIPNTVTTIDYFAFDNDTKLNKAVMLRNVTKIEDFAFENCSSLIIYGCKGSAAETYANTNGAKFVDISIDATKVTPEYSEILLRSGQTVSLKYTLEPSNTNDAVVLSSSDTSIVRIVENKINGIGAGTAKVTMTTSSGMKAVIIVHVGQLVYFKDDITYIPVGSEKQLYYLTPLDTDGLITSWISGDENIASAKDGKVTGINIGSATIYVNTKNGCVSHQVQVVPKLEGFVMSLYQTTLDRTPDASGLTYWTDQLSSGKQTGAQVVDYFVFGNEFTAKNYCNEHFLTHLYKAIFSREADTGGLTYWEGLMAKGMTREAVLNGFLGGSEFKSLCSNAGISAGTLPALPARGTIQTWPCSLDNKMDNGIGNFVLRMYTKCLGREAEKAGAAYWITQLNANKVGGTAVAEQFFLGTEFSKQNYSNTEYVTRLYRTIFGREPEAGGLSYWTGFLGKGTSRKTVIERFTSGTEWANICQEFGINN